MMSKILRKDFIKKTLSNGGYITWDTIVARGYLFSSDEKLLGSMQFRTYLKVTKNTELKKAINYYGLYENRHYKEVAYENRQGN